MQFYQLLEYCVKHVGSGAQVKLTSLQQGAINQNYCLRVDANKYLVKHFVGNRWLPTNRMHIFTLQAQLAWAGFAPVPIHLSDKQDVYIEQWIEYQALEHTEDSLARCIDTLADSLHRIHHSEINTDIINLPSHWSRYLKAMHDPERKWRKKAAEYSKIWKDYAARYGSDFVLCHNDLHLSHIAPDKKLYFDWEYAYSGCRFFDLIACILANQFDQNAANQLIRRYIELSDFHREEVLQRIRILQPLVIFTHQLWWQAHQFQTHKGR
jgi:thiamine kinase-like enzyme